MTASPAMLMAGGVYITERASPQRGHDGLSEAKESIIFYGFLA